MGLGGMMADDKREGHGEVHSAINEGLARACRCVSCPIVIIGLSDGADAFQWKYVDGCVLSLSEGGIDGIESVLRFAGVEDPVKWMRFVVFDDGFVTFYKSKYESKCMSGTDYAATGGEIIVEFSWELCDPGLVDRVRLWVGEQISSRRRYLEVIGRRLDG